MRDNQDARGRRWLDNSRWLFVALSFVAVVYTFVGAWLVTAGPSDPIAHTAAFIDHLVSRWMVATYVVAVSFIAFGVWYLRATPRRLDDRQNIDAFMRRQALWLTLVWAAVSASLTGISVLYVGELERTFRAEHATKEEAVARLKAGQVDQWLLDGSLEAARLAASLAELPLVGLPAEPNVRRAVDLLVAEFLAGNADRTAVSLVTPDGRVLVHLGEADAPQSDAARAALAAARQDQRAGIVDIYPTDETPPRLRMVFVTPVATPGGKGPATAILEISVDPYRGFFQRFDERPTPSAASAPVILRRDGDEAIFVTPPQYREPPPAPLSVRVPLTDTGLAEVQALLRGNGAYVGRDTRGVEVLAAAHRVTVLPWTVLVSTDLAETVGPLRRKEFTLLLVVGAATLLAAFMLLVLWRDGYAIHASARDITGRVALEREVASLSRVKAVLQATTRILLRGKDEEEVYRQLCRVMVELGDYRLAAVAIPSHDLGTTIRVLAFAGADDGYLSGLDTGWGEGLKSKDPTRSALLTGDIQVNQNFANDSSVVPWRAEALKNGYKSSVSLPIKAEGRTVAAFTLCAAQSDAFDGEEISLLRALVDDISFAISKLGKSA